MGVNVKRKGDDLFYNNKKLSVSIATKSTVSTLVHTGINLVSTGAPISVSSVKDMEIIDEDCLIEEIMKRFFAVFICFLMSKNNKNCHTKVDKNH